MKIDRIIWGILFLFVGGVILLENFDIINFYWRNVWQFWPIFLIIAGVNILFGKKENNIGAYISLGVLIVTLCYLFYRGQQPPNHRTWFGNNITTKFDDDNDDDNDDDREDNSAHKSMSFNEPYTAAGMEYAAFNFYGGGSSLDLRGSTNQLVAANIKKRYGNFSFNKEKSDSLYSVTMRMNNKKTDWNVGNSGNDVNLTLNINPIWSFNMNMGAGSVDMDLSTYKVKEFNFEGGAAALDLKFGDLLPMLNVHVKTGVADVKVNVPESSGCQIRSKTGLSVKDYEGFDKVSDGLYQTANFNTATKKVYLKLDGGLSNFEVRRY